MEIRVIFSQIEPEQQSDTLRIQIGVRCIDPRQNLADSCAADVTSLNLLYEGKNRRLLAISHVSPTYFSIRFCALRDAAIQRASDHVIGSRVREMIVIRPKNLLNSGDVARTRISIACHCTAKCDFETCNLFSRTTKSFKGYLLREMIYIMNSVTRTALDYYTLKAALYKITNTVAL